MSPRTDDRKPTSWTARVIAPVVLVVVAGALVLVISGSLNSSDNHNSDQTQKQTTTAGCSEASLAALKQGYYVVTADDVEGLSGIATKTCVPLDKLTALNPNLDPQALQVNNCVDLKPDGCKALSQGG
jgi:hypothetical protein